MIHLILLVLGMLFFNFICVTLGNIVNSKKDWKEYMLNGYYSVMDSDVKDGAILGLIFFLAERVTSIIFSLGSTFIGFDYNYVGSLCQLLCWYPIIPFLRHLWHKHFAFAFSLFLISQLLIRYSNYIMGIFFQEG